MFNSSIPESTWASFTVTTKDPAFFELMEKFSGSEAGRRGLITFKDSNWLLTVVLNHQPHFRGQPEDTFVWWGYGLFPRGPDHLPPSRPQGPSPGACALRGARTGC